MAAASPSVRSTAERVPTQELRVCIDMTLKSKQQIYGRYSARDGRSFEFDASWACEAIGVVWSATILADGRVVARPCGLLRGGVSDDEHSEEQVTRAIHAAIEALP
jgi:hypothetical protein